MSEFSSDSAKSKKNGKKKNTVVPKTYPDPLPQPVEYICNFLDFYFKDCHEKVFKTWRLVYARMVKHVKKIYRLSGGTICDFNVFEDIRK